MIYEYYGRTTADLMGLHGSAAWSRPRSVMPRSFVPDMDLALAELGTHGHVRSPAARVQMEPSEWFDRGLPLEPWSLRRFCELTHMESFADRPAFGRWTGEDVEGLLRSLGPYMFAGRWNGGLHAVVVVGYNDGADQVAYADPAFGSVVSRNLEDFNALMVGLGTAENPFWYRSPPQVREVVSDEP